MGTPEFAVPSLKMLLNYPGVEVAGVFTQPDRPKGRGNRLTASPVKQAALEAGIPVFQPEKIRKTGVEDLRELEPDLCVPWKHQCACFSPAEAQGQRADCTCNHDRRPENRHHDHDDG